MSIKKLTCCMARPMNAIRDLVSKVNEIVTAHNDHLENHPSWGGGSATSGMFVINATVSQSLTETQSLLATDKTFEETKNAFISGQCMAFDVCDMFGEGVIIRLPPLSCQPDSVEFGVIIFGANISVNFTANDCILDIAM